MSIRDETESKTEKIVAEKREDNKMDREKRGALAFPWKEKKLDVRRVG
jgi:hypothetical protein